MKKVSKNNLRTNVELPIPFHPQSSKDTNTPSLPCIFVSQKKGNFNYKMKEPQSKAEVLQIE